MSLKQWRILHAVIDCGGYAEAAKSLHLSQSTISYTVAKLQEQLGVPLLKLDGRKAILTTEGRALLERSRHVLKEAIELETFAKNLGQGCGGEVRLVVDQNFPTPLLMQTLRRFMQEGQGAAQVKLREIPVSQTDDVLHDLSVDLAISERVPLGLLGEPLIEVEHIPVAHADHPLFKLGRDVTAADLAQHVQIGIATGADAGHADAVPPAQMRRWLLNSFDTVVAAVRAGLGYAWLPQHRVQQWLDQGVLSRLPVGGKAGYKSVLYLIHGRPWSATPAASHFAEVLRGMVAEGADD
ncbi:MAG TPA: LysR family transcriptional regulator [Noviherbaspirillum sp.]|nr:LysR family transcriptional regulator [Noviherbaspirillum sp.]